jgi:hypothetical protein
VDITQFHLLICVLRNVWVASNLGVFWRKLLWTLVHMSYMGIWLLPGWTFRRAIAGSFCKWEISIIKTDEWLVVFPI